MCLTTDTYIHMCIHRYCYYSHQIIVHLLLLTIQQCYCNQSYISAMYRETTCPSSLLKIIAISYIPNTNQGLGVGASSQIIRKVHLQINIKEHASKA